MRFDLFAREKAFGGCVNGLESLAPGLLGNELAIDLYSLAGIKQVRRRIKAGPETGDAQRGGHHGAGGAFAIGAGDMDEATDFMGAAESGQEGLDPRKIPLDCFQLGTQGVEKSGGIREIHAAWS